MVVLHFPPLQHRSSMRRRTTVGKSPQAYERKSTKRGLESRRTYRGSRKTGYDMAGADVVRLVVKTPNFNPSELLRKAIPFLDFMFIEALFEESIYFFGVTDHVVFLS